MDPIAFREEADSIRDESPGKAAEMYAAAAALGDAMAASSLGYMLMIGEGIAKDTEKAKVYLQRAVDGGETKAMCNLGSLVMGSDPVRALELFEMAATEGSVTGMTNAATMLRTGAGVPADAEAAVRWLEIAAESDIGSMAVLAHMLRTGEGVPADKPRAAELYLRAAELGDADSQYDLAMMMDAGDGIPMDRTGAERWFRESASRGDNDARLCLGGILYERREFSEAAEVFTDAALDGDVKAMYNLALIYMGDELGEPDRAKAVEWLESASEAGFAYAQAMLGTILIDEGRVPEAAELLRKAADQNEPSSMYNLAALAFSGQVEMDDKEAIRLLAKAAEAGVDEARELIVRLSGQGLI